MKLILIAVLLASTHPAGLLAQSSERILIPFFTKAPIEGAFGSQWTTELSLLNDSGEDLAIAGYDQGCRLASCPPALTPPGITFFPSPSETRLQGAYLQIYPADAIEAVKVQLRARDLSRQSLDWGAEVPTIAESRAAVGEFTLLNVPVDPLYRLMLRLYHLGDGEMRAVVRFFEILPTRKYPFGLGVSTDRLIGEEVVTFTPPSPSSPGYAQIVDLFDAHPELREAQRLRIDVQSVVDGARIWGLMSVTNNDTQHVTYITPSSEPRASVGVVKPSCTGPAPLGGIETRPSIVDPDDYLVTFKQGVNHQTEAARLAEVYGFRVSGLISLVPGFTAVLRSDTVALLRCEESVGSVTFSRTNIPPP
jgi:hypothetical protein